MITGLTWLLACQLAGEVLVRLTGLPLPGPIVGMVLLFALLQVRRARDGGPGDDVLRAADGLLRHLQLLFIPAGVGVIAYLGTLRHDAVPIAAAMLASWVLGLLAVGWTTTALERWGSGRPGRRRDGRARG